VQLIAQAGPARDAYNYFGVCPASRRASVQVESPPPAPGDLELSFLPSSPAARRSPLAVDLRPASSGPLTWELVVRAEGPDRDVVLTWPDLTAVPATYRLTLVDRETGQRVSLRTAAAYRFRAEPGGARWFALESTPAVGGALTISHFAVAPTRGGTRLTFALSTPASVEARVCTLSGQPVVTIAADRRCAAGLNVLAWDGRDAAGRPLPSGTYLCALTASTPDREQATAVRLLTLTR
jgi:hypothetical protein